jgi:hypothetical protein
MESRDRIGAATNGDGDETLMHVNVGMDLYEDPKTADYSRSRTLWRVVLSRRAASATTFCGAIARAAGEQAFKLVNQRLFMRQNSCWERDTFGRIGGTGGRSGSGFGAGARRHRLCVSCGYSQVGGNDARA